MARKKSIEENRLDEFGKFLMANLRDPAIEYFDILAKGGWKAPGLAALQADLKSLSPEQLKIVRQCVLSCIDNGIHDFLFRLQEVGDLDGGIRVYVKGHDVSAISDGLHGELSTENGWIAKYSKFREAKASD